MKLDEALRVEGTDRYEILCYLLFPAGTIDIAVDRCRRAFSGSQFRTAALQRDGWPNEVVLVEVTLHDAALIPPVTLDCVHRALTVASCRGAVCMLDGAFCSYEDIFSSKVADQTYAFCVEPYSGVLCISTAVRASSGWRSIIEEHQRIAHGVADW